MSNLGPSWPSCFKITGGQRTLKNVLSALYLLNGWLDFNGTCTDISLGDAKVLVHFGDFDLIFKVTEGQRIL